MEKHVACLWDLIYSQILSSAMSPSDLIAMEIICYRNDKYSSDYHITRVYRPNHCVNVEANMYMK